MQNLYKNILSESQFVEDSKKYYGWSRTRVNNYVDSIVEGLETLKDWRINTILSRSKEFELNLMDENGGAVLEAGFGVGSFTIAAKLRGINIVGIDYKQDYVRLARQLASLAGFSDNDLFSTLKMGNVKDIQYRDNYFSMITCFGVLAYIDDIISTMREFMRVLKPGGILYLYSPDHRFPYEVQYDIPYLPFMKKDLFKIWLQEFDKPLGGLEEIPSFISLPIFAGIAKNFGFEFIEATVSLPETQIDTQIKKMIGNQQIDYLLSDPGKIFSLARKVRERNIKTKGAAFIVTCRKPKESLYPGKM